MIDDRGPLRRGEFAQRKNLSTPKIGDRKPQIEDHKTDSPPAQDGSRVNSNLAARLDSCQRIISLIKTAVSRSECGRNAPAMPSSLAILLLQSPRVGDLTPVPRPSKLNIWL